MAKRIIKKIGGDRIGSGNKMKVAMHGYGYSTHDVSKIRRTSMSFGTIVPMGCWLMPSNSRLRLRLDALITSNALNYQLYGSAKFQLDVFSARIAIYNPKMELNLNDQGYSISDIKFPQMRLTTRGYDSEINIGNRQVNASALIRYLGVAGNGQNALGRTLDVTRDHCAHELLMYYQTGKEYYCNKQEKVGMMIHAESPNANPPIAGNAVVSAYQAGDGRPSVNIPKGNSTGNAVVNGMQIVFQAEEELVGYTARQLGEQIGLWVTYTHGANAGQMIVVRLIDVFRDIELTNFNERVQGRNTPQTEVTVHGWGFYLDMTTDIAPNLVEFDLKAIDRMSMEIMANVKSTNPLIIDENTELPYGATFRSTETNKCVNYSQEGLLLGTYQSDVFNNWLDNSTINALTAKNKVKVDENGEFSIDMLNITQKLYNYDMRIGATDGTLGEWREVAYGAGSIGKTQKPVYEGGLSKEIVFDQVVSTASTDESPLGDIASRGQFGSKHKGGYAQIDTEEERIVMVLAKITPRIVYNQGNVWTTTLKTLEDIHKPALDKIGYQNLITDTMAVWDTKVNADGSLVTKSAGKQPAWQLYRTNYDDALGNMADQENYKVFGREYDAELEAGFYKIKDLTTYIDPMKYNDVFAIESLDAQNFDVQVGMDATMTLTMSEEVIPNL